MKYQYTVKKVFAGSDPSNEIQENLSSFADKGFRLKDTIELNDTCYLIFEREVKEKEVL